MLTNNGKQQNAPWWHGRKGEHLVALQFVILILFIVLPEWTPGSGGMLQESTTMIRVTVLALCCTTALVLGGMGSHNLKKYVTPLPYPVDHSELVQTGIYSLVRHPLYSSQLVAGFGWTVYTLSVSHLILLAAAFFFFNYKAGKEEGWLTERHPEYREYAVRVKKFIPWVY